VIHTPGHTQGSVSLYLPQDAGKVTAARTITSVIDETGEKIDIADLLKKTVDPDGIRETEPVPDESELILPARRSFFPGIRFLPGASDAPTCGRLDGTDYEFAAQQADALAGRNHRPPRPWPVTTIGNERQLNPFLQPE